MSVAEQTASAPVSYSPETKLAGNCLLGALFVLGSLAFIFNILPTVWHWVFAGAEPGKEILKPFLSGALLMIAEIGAMVIIGYCGFWLDKTFSSKGLRAGSIFGALAFFVAVWITIALGNILNANNDLGTGVSIGITAVVLLVLLFAIVWVFMLSGFGAFLVGLEEQGWFYTSAYKPNQGHKVRRATIVGILAIGFCGIYTMINHRVLGSGLSENTWFWWIPFTTNRATNEARFLPLIYNVHLVVPLLLGIALLWLASRITNWPSFADFLIATEAEINKVSWTTRKRLVTDTIVVLVTVFFLTAFLFVVDILWIKILSSQFVSVLYVDIRSEQAKQQEKTHW